MKEGRYAGLLEADELFENIERRKQRIFSNLINPQDWDAGFLQPVSGCKDSESIAVHGRDIYNPESYVIPEDSFLTSSDTATLVLLTIGTINTINPKNDANKKSSYPKECLNYYEDMLKADIADTPAIKLDGLFLGDENRRMAGNNALDLNKGYNTVKNLIQKNNYDELAKLIENGLKGIRDAYNFKDDAAMPCALRGYIYCNICEKTLDLLDKNPAFAKKVKIDDNDREYYEGMRQYARLIRKNEKLLAKETKNSPLTDDEQKDLTDYKNIQYLISKEIANKAVGSPSYNKLFEQYETELKRLAFTKGKDELSAEEKEKWNALPKAEKEKWDIFNKYVKFMIPTCLPRYLLRNDISYIRSLGKCKNSKEMNNFFQKVTAEAENLKTTGDEDFKNAIEKVDSRIAQIHLSGNDLKKHLNDGARIRQLDAQKEEINSILNLNKAEICEQLNHLEDYYQQINSTAYDKKSHQNLEKHKEFQEMKHAVNVLREYRKGVITNKMKCDLEKEKKYIKRLQETAEAYLDLKDPQKLRQLRPNDRYADKRYNIALNLSKLTAPLSSLIYLTQVSDQISSDIRKAFEAQISDDQRKKISILSAEVRTKAVESMLMNDPTCSKLFTKKAAHENLNLTNLPPAMINSLTGLFNSIILSKETDKEWTDEKFLNYFNDQISQQSELGQFVKKMDANDSIKLSSKKGEVKNTSTKKATSKREEKINSEKKTTSEKKGKVNANTGMHI